MSHALTALITFIATVLLCAMAQNAIERQQVAAGFWYFGNNVYRLVRVEP